MPRSPVTRLIDGWLCKAAPDLPFRRSNAVLPPVGASAEAHAAAGALDAIEAWYRSMGQRVLVQVTTADPSCEELDRMLEARGYGIEAPVDILVAEVMEAADAGERAADGLLVSLEEAGVATGDGPAGLDLRVVEGVD